MEILEETNLAQWTNSVHCSHSESLESSKIEVTCSFCIFWQSSSAIHVHASVQERLLTLQEQFWVKVDLLHRHVVSSMMLFGTLSIDINTGTNLSTFNFQPFPSGNGSVCKGTRAFLLTYVW